MENVGVAVALGLLFLAILFVALVLGSRPSPPEEKAPPLGLQKGDLIVLKGSVQKVERWSNDPEAVEVLSVSEGSPEKPHIRFVRVKYPQVYEMTHEIDLMARDVLRWNYNDE